MNLRHKLYILMLTVPVMPISAHCKQLVVAVVDTGTDISTEKLCNRGHISYTDDSPLSDSSGHGTHIAGLINKHAGNKNYCIVSIKWWKPGIPQSDALLNMRLAIDYAAFIKADIINISGGGEIPNVYEKLAVRRALSTGAIMVAASGNNGKDLDADCNFFPACYDSRIVVVGNLEQSSVKNASSNYGNYVKRWEVGTNVSSRLPNNRTGNMTGTSQATAIATGKILNKLAK